MTGLAALTLFHVLLALVQIVAGIVLFSQVLNRRISKGIVVLFLVMTAGNLITGFLFPFHGVTPAIVIGILNVLILVPTAIAWSRQGARRLWTAVFVFGSLLLLYFDCLVLIVQSFQKVPPLHALAPTGGEPAVLVSQVGLLVLAVLLGYQCFRRTRGISV
jgi:hypothetical protein